jgi:hypothetical protein
MELFFSIPRYRQISSLSDGQGKHSHVHAEIAVGTVYDLFALLLISLPLSKASTL